MQRILHRGRTGHTSTRGGPRRRRALLIAPLLAAGLVAGSAGAGASNSAQPASTDEEFPA